MGETDYPIFEEKTSVIDTDALVQNAKAVNEFLAKMAQNTPEGEMHGVATLALTGFSKKYGFGGDGLFSVTLQRDKLPLEVAMQEEMGHGELAVLDMVNIVCSNIVSKLEADSEGVPTMLSEPYVAVLVTVNSRLAPGSTIAMLIPVDAITHMEKFEGLV